MSRIPTDGTDKTELDEDILVLVIIPSTANTDKTKQEQEVSRATNNLLNINSTRTSLSYTHWLISLLKPKPTFWTYMNLL